MRRALLLVLAAPAAAQDAPPVEDARTFQVPAGCAAYLTVQEASCTVEHLFTCEGDPEGWQRRVEMDEGGVALATVIDRETQWIESDHFAAGFSERLAPSNPDPASLDALLATGLDTYDFSTDSPEYGRTRYVGEDRLTGETVTIDGVALERTAFSIVATDAADKRLWRAEGSQFVSRDWRTFLGGTERVVTADGVEELDSTPVEFIEPGEPGFLSVSPKHGCGLVVSSRNPFVVSPQSEGRG